MFVIKTKLFKILHFTYMLRADGIEGGNKKEKLLDWAPGGMEYQSQNFCQTYF